MKQFVPKDKLVTSGQGWAQDFTPTSIRLIGLAEILGAAGLILPAVTHIAPILRPLGCDRVGSRDGGRCHCSRAAQGTIVVLLALAVFVAWGGLGAYPFTS